jgi:hypothetical protein
MSKHTHGPWRVSSQPIINGKYAGCFAIKPEAGPPFAVMIGGGPNDLRQANASLIAAAPDLLEACRHALAHIEVDECTHGRPFSAGNLLRAAIDRAESAS